MATATVETNRAEEQAVTQFDSIKEMVALLNSKNDEERDKAIKTIEADPLTVEIRSAWHFPGGELVLDEYKISLCTGGPAVRIIGELDEHREPCSVKLEYQDWFTPWEGLYLDDKEEEILTNYACVFYFGE